MGHTLNRPMLGHKTYFHSTKKIEIIITVLADQDGRYGIIIYFQYEIVHQTIIKCMVKLKYDVQIPFKAVFAKKCNYVLSLLHILFIYCHFNGNIYKDNK